LSAYPFFDGRFNMFLSTLSTLSTGSDSGERFSRKVFVGGLPPDIDEGEFKCGIDFLVLSASSSCESTSLFPLFLTCDYHDYFSFCYRGDYGQFQTIWTPGR